MTEAKIHVFDVGTIIEVDMDEDLDDVAEQEFHVQKPDGSEVVWPATISSDLLSYEIASGDLDIPGRWIVQPFLRFAGSMIWKGHGDSVEFEVYPEFSLD